MYSHPHFSCFSCYLRKSVCVCLHSKLTTSPQLLCALKQFSLSKPVSVARSCTYTHTSTAPRIKNLEKKDTVSNPIPSRLQFFCMLIERSSFKSRDELGEYWSVAAKWWSLCYLLLWLHRCLKPMFSLFNKYHCICGITKVKWAWQQAQESLVSPTLCSSAI